MSEASVSKISHLLMEHIHCVLPSLRNSRQRPPSHYKAPNFQTQMDPLKNIIL